MNNKNPYLSSQDTSDIKELNLQAINNEFANALNSYASDRNERITITRIETEIGTMIAGATPNGICMLEFADSKKLETELKQLVTLHKLLLAKGEHPYFNTLRQELKSYFEGKLRRFTMPLDVKGTDFQVQVWLSLANIPYGSTTTYGKQAEALGKPSAVRAVANANGKNRISILLPCHRVIGSDGTLTGYGGGMWRKQRLLELEKGEQRFF